MRETSYSKSTNIHIHLPRIVQQRRLGIFREKATGEVIVGVHQGPNAQYSNKEACCVEGVLEHWIDHRRMIFGPQIIILKIMT
jgi:hypothetical protein